jgi:ABC-2 type transport system permease protein
MNGCGSYLWLEIRRTLRNGRYVVFTLGFPAGFYLLFTMLYGKSAAAAGYDFNALYMVAMAAYGATGAALNTNSIVLAMERASGWTRQLRVTPLGPAAYVLAKAAMAVCVALPAVAVVSLLGVLVRHVQLSAQAWAGFLLATWLGTLPFAALGVLLGYALDPQSAQAGTLIVYFALSILGGLWFPYSIMPHAMQVVARLLPSYHFAALGWNAVAGRWVGWRNLGILAAYTGALGTAAVFRYRRDEAREYV